MMLDETYIASMGHLYNFGQISTSLKFEPFSWIKIHLFTGYWKSGTPKLVEETCFNSTATTFVVKQQDVRNNLMQHWLRIRLSYSVSLTVNSVEMWSIYHMPRNI